MTFDSDFLQLVESGAEKTRGLLGIVIVGDYGFFEGVSLNGCKIKHQSKVPGCCLFLRSGGLPGLFSKCSASKI